MALRKLCSPLSQLQRVVTVLKYIKIKKYIFESTKTTIPKSDDAFITRQNHSARYHSFSRSFLTSGSRTWCHSRDLSLTCIHTSLLPAKWDFSGKITYNYIKNYNKTNKNIQIWKYILDLDLLYAFLDFLVTWGEVRLHWQLVFHWKSPVGQLGGMICPRSSCPPGVWWIRVHPFHKKMRNLQFSSLKDEKSKCV